MTNVHLLKFRNHIEHLSASGFVQSIGKFFENWDKVGMITSIHMIAMVFEMAPEVPLDVLGIIQLL